MSAQAAVNAEELRKALDYADAQRIRLTTSGSFRHLDVMYAAARSWLALYDEATKDIIADFLHDAPYKGCSGWEQRHVDGLLKVLGILRQARQDTVRAVPLDR